MQPSSLIFLVIVAIWVAYLIQHWVRRREHLATAHSVDRFSEAMRVLERRSPLPTTMLATATSGPRSSATVPPSSGPPSGERPEVVVKRASVSSPLRARAGSRGEAGHGHEVAPIELVPHRTTAQIVLRRVRGLLFLAAVLAVPATITLSFMHILKWLSVILAGAAVVLVLVWLRFAAIRERKARRARRAELRRLERLRAAGTVRSAEESGVPPNVAPAKRSVAQPSGPAVQASTPTPEPVVPVVPVVPVAVADLDPGAWQPVPVPPPTYTLKEPAHRPEPAAERPYDDGPGMRPVPIEVEDDDEVEIMAAAPRRRAVGR